MYNLRKQGRIMVFSTGVEIYPMYHNSHLSESLAYVEERSDYFVLASSSAF